MTFDAKRHWRTLCISCLGVLCAGLLLPRFVEAPLLRENRKLAPAPASPRNWAELRAWPKAADAYVADRFPARAHLVAGLNYVRYRLGVSGSDRVVIGRDGWLFYNTGDDFAVSRNTPPYDDAQASAWLEGLAGRTEWLQARGASYVVLFAPDKETVVPQYAPSWFALSPDRAARRLARLNDMARAGDMVSPASDLTRQALAGAAVYNRVETHWTGLGAYAGYDVLLRRLHDVGAAEAPAPLAMFRQTPEGPKKPRNLSLMLGIASFADAPYAEFEDPTATPRVTYLTASRHWTSPQLIETGHPAKPTLLLMRDSFSLALLPFLQNSFSRIVVVHNQDGAWRPDLVERFKPDVVVTEVVESGAPFIMQGSPPASPQAKARIAAALATPHHAPS